MWVINLMVILYYLKCPIVIKCSEFCYTMCVIIVCHILWQLLKRNVWILVTYYTSLFQPTLASLHQFWICPTYILSIHPTMHQRNAKWFVLFYVLLHFCIGSLVFNNTLFCKIFVNENMFVIDFVTNNCFFVILVGTH